MFISEVELLTSDIDHTKDFYHGKLGMDILYADDRLLKISAGLSTLVFKRQEDSQAFYHFAFTIPSNQFEEAHAWASALLPLMPIAPGETVADFRNWKAKAFYFPDNNRNIVEFIARFDLDNRSERSFDGRSVVCISEMGIVTDEVKFTCDQLIGKFGLEVFFRQPMQEDFAAIGDNNGLFIVVKNNRNWYPTHQPAGKFWSSIKFRSGEKENVVNVGNVGI